MRSQREGQKLPPPVHAMIQHDEQFRPVVITCNLLCKNNTWAGKHSGGQLIFCLCVFSLVFFFTRTVYVRTNLAEVANEECQARGDAPKEETAERRKEFFYLKNRETGVYSAVWPSECNVDLCKVSDKTYIFVTCAHILAGLITSNSR